MLTRSGVAKELGCSLATVRRLEGQDLFPERDGRGVHWFDEREVERVRRRFSTGRVTAAKGEWLATAGSERRGSKLGPRTPATDSTGKRARAIARGDRRIAELERDNQRLRVENADLQRRFAVLLGAVEAMVESGPTQEVLTLLEAACGESQ